MACISLNRLPQNMINTLMSPLSDDPSLVDNWSDFNKLHKYWRELGRQTNDTNGLFCNSDLGTEPNYLNYYIEE